MRTVPAAATVQIKALAGSAMDPRVFGFIEPPPPERMEAALHHLKQARTFMYAQRHAQARACTHKDIHTRALLVLSREHSLASACGRQA